MNIGLIQIDGELPNLALMKISAWHKNKGDKITLMRDKTISKRLIPFDKVYISCIFDENKERAFEIAKQFNCDVSIGGVGADNNIMLPNEIDHLMPDYDLYKSDFSMGFTTRGCIRKCSYCKVSRHEGMIKENTDIYEFWDKRHKNITLLDNNILALPNHFKKVAQQIKDNNLIVDINQGLDHRLLTPELCQILLSLRHKNRIYFAFDNIAYKPSVIKAMDMLKEAGLKDWHSRWYIYISENDTFQSVYERMIMMKEYKQAVYVMRDKKIYHNPIYIALSQWGNTVATFMLGTLEESISKSDRMKPYTKVLLPYLKEIKQEQTKLS